MKKVSVITINFNNLSGLKRTIPSVLSQECNDYEYIVIDGGSTDGSKEYIASHQDGIDLWISEKDKGIYNAMNKGISLAHGEYCIFMNSGDHFFSSCALENAIKELNGSDYCVGRTVVVEDDFVSLSTPPQNLTFDFIKENSLQHQSTFIKTSLLKQYPYDENLKIIADWEQFFENWYFRKCSYKAINTIISAYYMDGVSSINVELTKQERETVFNALFADKTKLPKTKETKELKQERITAELLFKLRRAMRKKPLARDWKILRNSFRILWKDLFI